MRRLVCVALLAWSACSPRGDGERGVEYRGGLWFDGTGFEEANWYEVDGRFRSAPPAALDSVVDLAGRWVVPPYGEAHNHILEPALVEQYVRMYMNHGIFYIRDQGNSAHTLPPVAERMGGWDSPDLISARQGFTGPGGHPLQILLELQRMGAYPSGAELDGAGLVIVEDLDELRTAWPRFLEGDPDFVKVFLLYSEEHGARKGDPEYRFRRGLDPALVPWIVERAHAEGLEVSAHVYSAPDFRTAVAAGVDMIAHMPGNGYDPELGPERFRLTAEDARRAAEGGVTVVTTMVATGAAGDSLQRDVLRSNLRTLREAGVPVVVGSDLFRATSREEAEGLATLGAFTNLELLRSWAVDTPRSIFPGRRIGRFAPGFEASFLVLEGNPLADASNLFEIRRRVKRGRTVPYRSYAFPETPGG